MLKHIPFYASLMEQSLLDGKKPTMSQVLVYGAVEAHSFGERGCIASNKTIATEIGLSEGRVANIISELSMSDWIKVHLDGDNHRTLIEPMMTLHVGVNPPSRESEPPLHGDVNIEHSKENTVIDNKNKTKKEIVPGIELLFKIWEQIYGYPPKQPAAERREVKKLIKQYDEKTVARAIKAAYVVKDIEYAPVITSFKDLWYKWEKLEGFYRRKQQKQATNSVTIKE